MGDIEVTSTTGNSRFSFSPNGSATGESTFELGGGFTPRYSASGLKKLQDVAKRIGESASRITWRIANRKKNGPPIEAAFDLSEPDAERLRTTIGPCYETPRR